MTAPVVDGRAARKAATRDAIADALLDLLHEGNLRPTAREIASRAGISLRSVYVHFDDLEDLFCVAAQRHYGRVAPMLEPASTDGPLATRASAFVRRRVGIYAQLGPVGRATALQAPFSPTLARIVQDAQTRGRREIERMFEPELVALADDRRVRTIALLAVLTGMDAWETLRDEYELSDDEIVETVVAAILSELAS
jgi:AcrR family transcriptional regulator